MSAKWKAYNPIWLVELAKDQRPDLPWLAESLTHCTACWRKSRIMSYFVSPDRANQPAAEWQFKEVIELVHPEHGRLKLEVLKDGRIGGIEFYDRLFRHP